MLETSLLHSETIATLEQGDQMAITFEQRALSTPGHSATSEAIELRECTLLDALRMMLFTLVGVRQRTIETTEDQISFQLFPSHPDNPHWLVVFRGAAEEVQLLKATLKAGIELDRTPVHELVDQMTTKEGAEVWQLPMAEIFGIQRRFAPSSPWRVMTIFQVFGLNASWEVMARWNSTSLIDDFLRVALMAHRQKVSFEEAEEALGLLSNDSAKV